ncbi:MAG TPA: tetratricopeptide repeat protein [Burkholderiales bacterium]|nr:tetratricopeptide repeat protein [Burkholderiales bacterium]
MKNPLKSLFAALLAGFLIAFVPPAAANLGDDDVAASDDPNFQEGRKALESQDWKKAVDLFSKAVQSDPKNADAHNFLGYAYRKVGKVDSSFNHYNEALKLNPKHKHAHEYIGEAYLLTDNLPKAERHLAELQKLCTPIPCEEYKELKRAVDNYKKNKK